MFSCLQADLQLLQQPRLDPEAAAFILRFILTFSALSVPLRETF